MADDHTLQLTDEYKNWLSDLKNRIRSARQKALLAVNKELVLLYWQIGHEILHRQERCGWGSKIVNQLSADLKKAFRINGNSGKMQFPPIVFLQKIINSILIFVQYLLRCNG